jgi:hypothetical protein
MMRALVVALTLSLVSPAFAGDIANAQNAYQSLLSRFWMGSPANGHLAILTQTTVVGGSSAGEIPPKHAWLWQYAEAWNVLYACYKTSCSSDAQTRLQAEWNWVQANWTLSGVGTQCAASVCGWTSQDDVSWVAMGLVEFGDALSSATALTWAKSAIDGGNAAFLDSSIGGNGLNYVNSPTPPNSSGKQISNGNFGLAELEYYQLQCPIEGGSCPLATVYYTAAKGLADWGNTYLIRTNATICSASNDNLYWMGVYSNAGVATVTEGNCSQPYVIRQATSVTALFGNMAFAALNARVYNMTATLSYKTQALATAASIMQYELYQGGFMDDRDARGNGFAAWNFANDVLPLMTTANATAAKIAYFITARGVSFLDRASDSGFGGDWEGPVLGVWWNAGGPCAGNVCNQDRLEISANAAIWPVVAAQWAAN